MIKGKKVLAIIPARRGSKRLLDKNIRDLNGKPLIAWTIEAAKRNRYLDKVVVSTEDDRIAYISKEYGAEVPFIRPAELATDAAETMDVIIHCMDYFEQNNQAYDIIILLQATSPLREAQDIDRALEFFMDKKTDAVVSVVESEYSPELSGTLPENLNMQKFIKKEVGDKNRQELKTYYRINGAIYIAKWDYIKDKLDWYGPNTFAYIMDKKNSVDIDTIEDFLFAETLMKNSV